MYSTRVFARTMALAGATTLLLGSSAFAQNRDEPRTYDQRGNRGYANRMVEGTVASVVSDRDGDRVRLTNGTDLVVPNSVTSMNQGRRFGASMLQPGDVVRLNVYSREGDNRGAQVRSLELLQTNSVYNNGRQMSGTVVSINRRARTLVMQTDNGRTVNVDLNAVNSGSFRRGDRISVSGRMNRGIVFADDVHMGSNDRYEHRRY